MESSANHEPLKGIECDRQVSRDPIDASDLSLEFSHKFKASLGILGKEAVDLAVELEILDLFDIDVSFKENCFILLVVVRPVANWDQPRVILLRQTVNFGLRIFRRFLRIDIFLEGALDDTVGAAFALSLFAFIEYSEAIAQVALAVEEAHPHVGEVDENVDAGLEAHLK